MWDGYVYFWYTTSHPGTIAPERLREGGGLALRAVHSSLRSLCVVIGMTIYTWHGDKHTDTSNFNKFQSVSIVAVSIGCLPSAIASVYLKSLYQFTFALHRKTRINNLHIAWVVWIWNGVIFQPKLTHPAAQFLCDSRATSYSWKLASLHCVLHCGRRQWLHILAALQVIAYSFKMYVVFCNVITVATSSSAVAEKLRCNVGQFWVCGGWWRRSVTVRDRVTAA